MIAPRLGQELETVVVPPERTVSDAMIQMDRAGTGCLVVTDERLYVLGLLTDGDVRRAIINGTSVSAPCGGIATLNPKAAPVSISDAQAISFMEQHDIIQLPLLNDEHQLGDLLLLRALVDVDGRPPRSGIPLESVMVQPDSTVQDAIRVLDSAGTGAIAICSEVGRLLGILTDGDIRRAILRKTPTGVPCLSIATTTPVAAPKTISARDALKLMQERDVNHLPLIDGQERLVDLVVRSEMTPHHRTDAMAVIMAGGFGKRLLPLTERVPKPMLPVGDMPILERTIRRMLRAGITDITLATHYRSQSIIDYFGHGERFGVNLSYLQEDEPLGTAGALRMVNTEHEHILVINGDVLTGVPFDQMLLFHRQQRASLTVGAREYSFVVPFGVLDCDDTTVTAVYEKPKHTVFVNAGVYSLRPEVCRLIPPDVRFDMTDLIGLLIERGNTVSCFPIHEYWRDIGRPDDYAQANRDIVERVI